MIKRIITKTIDRITERVVVHASHLAYNRVHSASSRYIPNYSYDPLLRRQTHQLAAADKGTQILLSLQYQELVHRELPLPRFGDVEFRCFSQNGEDGILHYIFSLIGTTNKKSVEVCAGNGIECNTANLIINHGWVGLLFDGSEGNITTGKEFYSKCQETYFYPPTLVHAWITAENINQLISSNGVDGEVDLLSLDMDGVDYWIWKAIDCIDPRVVVLEYQRLWGPDRSVTVPYRPDFRYDSSDSIAGNYHSASLSAFVKLGRKKGYRLVGCQRFGLNAFFMRSDVGSNMFPEVPASKCFEIPLLKSTEFQRAQEWFSHAMNREWIEV